jgi:O-antigen ligase
MGVAGGLLLLIFLIPKRKELWFSWVFFAVAIMILSPNMKGRMMSVVSNTQGTSGDQQSKSTRLSLWKQSWEAMQIRPLTGVGLKGVAFSVPDPISGVRSDWSETHNNFLQVGVETGWIGLGLFIWIVFLIARLIVRHPHSEIKSALAALCVALLIAGLTESWLADKEVAMIFWYFVGWAAASRREAYSSCA